MQYKLELEINENGKLMQSQKKSNSKIRKTNWFKEPMNSSKKNGETHKYGEKIGENSKRFNESGTEFRKSEP